LLGGIQLNGWAMEHVTIIASIIMFIVGCSLGAFLNVIGIRLALHKSIVFPAWSCCVHCDHRLGIADLLPVVPWMIRGGKCRRCGASISPLLRFGQLGTGISFAAATYWITDIRELWMAYLLICILVILSISDLKYRLLPNKIIIPAMALYVPLRLWIHDLPYWEYMAGFVVGGGILFTVSYISLRMGKPAMGGGDIKLMALLGLVLGIKLILLTLAFSALLGCIFGLILMALGIISRRTFIPFGPFIAIAAIIVMLFGNHALSWYWSLFPFISI
jgi:leader peptidase (prepilin peptidase)/N-methyltransferase